MHDLKLQPQGATIGSQKGSLMLSRGAVATDVLAPSAPVTLGRREAPCPIVRIHLLGAMRATTYLGDNVVPQSADARAILGCLCLAPGGTLTRMRLASVLSNGTSDAHARLGRALSEIRDVFGAFANELISMDRQSVQFDTNACWIDAVALLSESPSQSRSDLAVLCAGELLEGLDGVSPSFDDWLFRERKQFREQLHGLLESERDAEPRATLDHVARSPGEPHQPAAGRNRLRIGVLPFDGNGSQNEANLAFSLSHEVAIGLARFRWFDVIAPISMSRRPLADFLGEDVLQRHQLDYAVDGIVSKIGNGFHISVRLLDLTESARPVWGDRLELPVGELHRLNEMIVGRIVASIDPVILFIEGQPKRKERYGASGLLFLAIPLIYSMERRKFQQAGELIERALQIEPENPLCLTLAAYWHLWHVGQGWTRDVHLKFSTVEDLCLKAIKLDPNNSEAMGIYAHTFSWRKDFDSALHYFDRSLRLNPNLAYIWALSAVTYCYIGEPETALKRLSRYHDLAPFDPYYNFFESAYTIAYTVKQDYERAVVVGRRVVKSNPDFINGYKPLISSLGHLGRREEAKPYIDRVRSLEPKFSIEQFSGLYPFKYERDLEHYVQGLRLAGVPER